MTQFRPTFCLLIILSVSVAAVAQSNEEIDERLNEIIEQYMNTKNGLVHNRDDLAAAWAERMETTIATTPNEIFSEDELSEWQAYQQVLHQASGAIVDADNIDEQRQALIDISTELRSLLEYFGNPGDTLYVFSCSDYGDSEAIWLNDSEQVANPYHGPENMDCGELVDSF